MSIKNTFLVLFSLIIFNCSKENSPKEEIILDEPISSTSQTNEIHTYSVLIIGEISRFGDYNIIDHGFVVSTNSAPTINDNIISLGSTNSLGEFQSKFQNLEPNTDYYVRTFLKYDGNTVKYGNSLSFKTLETNIWTQKSSALGGFRNDAVSFKVDSKLFIGTGYDINGRTNAFIVYDYKNDSWNEIADLPSNLRNAAISFSIGSYGFVGLGKTSGNNYLNDLWRYSPENNTWEQMADFPGEGRSKSVSFVIGDKAYVTGGTSDDRADLWEYDSNTNVWTEKASYPGSCATDSAAFSINNKGYVGFGWNNGNCNDFWEYDPVLDSWTEKETLPANPRSGVKSFSIMNNGYIACGVYQETSIPMTEYLSEIWKYNQPSNSWTQINPSYPGIGRLGMIAEIIDDRLFIGLGGDTINVDDSIWEYSIEIN